VTAICVGTDEGGGVGAGVGVGLGLGLINALIKSATCLGSIFGAGFAGTSVGGTPLVVCATETCTEPASKAAAPISLKLACRIDFAPAFPPRILSAV